MTRPLTVATLAAAIGGRLVADGAASAASVEHVRIATDAASVEDAAAGELVVAEQGQLPADPAARDALVARWHDAGVAGVVVSAAEDRLAGELGASAAHLGLPVVVTGRRLVEVASDVTRLVLDAQHDRLQRALHIHDRFARVAAGGGGSGEIADVLHDLLGVPVAILGSHGDAIAVAPPDAVVPADGAATARYPIVAGDESYGHVVAMTDEAALDEDGRLAMEQAAVAVAVRLAQAAAVAEAQERFAAISLEQLVAGDVVDAAEIAERARSFGWDLDRPRAVLLASIDPPVGAERAGVLATIAAAARATLGRDAIVWVRGTSVAALLAPVTPDPDERRRVAERLREELDVRLRQATVSIGVGRRVDTPAQLARSFDEANRAVEVGRWAKGRHVTEVYDLLGLERLLARASSDDLSEFVEHAIGPLLAYDRVNRTELVETFGAWLETRNMAAAARRMHVHYNTFKNRLERIEEVLGWTVDDAERLLECEIALYITRHYDGPWR